MYSMFYNAGAFNQALGSWQTTTVKLMYGMFNGAVSPTRHKRRWSRSYTATTSLDVSVTTSTPTSSLAYDHRQAPSTPG